MKKQKGTISILESIRNKMHKIEKPSVTTPDTEVDSDDDFEYIDSSKEIINSSKQPSLGETANISDDTENNTNKDDDDFDFLSSEKNETGSGTTPPAEKSSPAPINAKDTLETKNQPLDTKSEATSEEKNTEESLLEKLQRERIEKSKTETLETKKPLDTPAVPAPQNAKNDKVEEVDDLTDPEDLEEDLEEENPEDDIFDDAEEGDEEEKIEDKTANLVATEKKVVEIKTEEIQETVETDDFDNFDDIEEDSEEKTNDATTLDEIEELSEVKDSPLEPKEKNDDMETDDLDDINLDDLDKIEDTTKEDTDLNDLDLKEDADLEDLDLDEVEEEKPVKDVKKVETVLEKPLAIAPTQKTKQEKIDDDLNDLDLEEEINAPITKNINSNKMAEQVQNNNSIEKNNMISDHVAKKTTDSIKELISSIPKKQQLLSTQSPAFKSGQTIEDMVAELLAPRLEQWLNENLPSMVEKIVKEEIKKLIPQD